MHAYNVINHILCSNALVPIATCVPVQTWQSFANCRHTGYARHPAFFDTIRTAGQTMQASRLFRARNAAQLLLSAQTSHYYETEIEFLTRKYKSMHIDTHLFDVGSYTVTVANIRNLFAKGWLDDVVVNAYAELINQKYKDVFCFNSFFFTQLMLDPTDTKFPFRWPSRVCYNTV